MKLTDSIRAWWQSRRKDVLIDNTDYGYFGGLQVSKYPFANVIFANIYELLTDLCNDVTFARVSGDTMLFAGFRTLFDNYGQEILNRLFEQGFVVIGKKDWRFWIMNQNEFTTVSEIDVTAVKPYDPRVEVYVMRSQCWNLRNMSDKQYIAPWLKYLDNVLNGSNTVSERLGSFIIMSPQNPPTAPTAYVLPEDTKEKYEKQLQAEYGSLHSQKSIMLLKQSMSAQIVNMAGLDQKTTEKVKMAILAICDRIKVPANQVAIIDAMSSKSFANGTEMREGDFNKYQSFERLLNATFVQMAAAYGLQVDYSIYNKPTRVIKG